MNIKYNNFRPVLGCSYGCLRACCCPGPTGATGAAGAQGTKGIQGVQAITGDTDPQGVQGLQGITGPTGSGITDDEYQAILSRLSAAKASITTPHKTFRI